MAAWSSMQLLSSIVSCLAVPAAHQGRLQTQTLVTRPPALSLPSLSTSFPCCPAVFRRLHLFGLGLPIGLWYCLISCVVDIILRYVLLVCCVFIMYYILCRMYDILCRVMLSWYVVYLLGIVYVVVLSYAGMVSIGLWYLLPLLCCFFSSVE